MRRDKRRRGRPIADPAQRRIGVHRVGRYPAVGGTCAALKIGQHDLAVLVAGVGEGPALVDVTDRPDAGHVGFQLAIGGHKATLVGLDTHRSQVEALGVGAAPGGDQQVRAFDPMSTHRHGDPGIGTLFHQPDLVAGVEADALCLQHLGEGFRDRLVFAASDARVGLDHGDFAAEPAKDLPHL